LLFVSHPEQALVNGCSAHAIAVGLPLVVDHKRAGPARAEGRNNTIAFEGRGGDQCPVDCSRPGKGTTRPRCGFFSGRAGPWAQRGPARHQQRVLQPEKRRFLKVGGVVFSFVEFFFFFVPAGGAAVPPREGVHGSGLEAELAGPSIARSGRMRIRGNGCSFAAHPSLWRFFSRRQGETAAPGGFTLHWETAERFSARSMHIFQVSLWPRGLRGFLK